MREGICGRGCCTPICRSLQSARGSRYTSLDVEMNFPFFDLICVGVGLGYITYTLRRARHAANSDRVAGFILNPCFYLSGYGFLYLLLGTLLSEAGQELWGFAFSDETRSLSNSLMLYY